MYNKRFIVVPDTSRKILPTSHNFRFVRVFPFHNCTQAEEESFSNMPAHSVFSIFMRLPSVIFHIIWQTGDGYCFIWAI